VSDIVNDGRVELIAKGERVLFGNGKERRVKSDASKRFIDILL